MADHNVKLDAYTHRINAQPEDTLGDHIVYYARVSNPASQQQGKNNSKLLTYLHDNAHWSPFDMVDITMDIGCTRSIGRQLLRHWTFRFQEWSQRYAATETHVAPIKARLQDHTNRQNSLPADDEQLQLWWREAQRSILKETFETYDQALKRGVAKEVARNILPEGLTYSRLFMKGTIRSWIHYCMVRTHESTQLEHRELALDIVKQIKRVFPEIEVFVS